MGHDAEALERAAWIGADGGAIILGLERLTDFSLSLSPELVGGAFLVAGAAGIAGKAGVEL
jgi:hypothetical protein